MCVCVCVCVWNLKNDTNELIYKTEGVTDVEDKLALSLSLSLFIYISVASWVAQWVKILPAMQQTQKMQV